MSLGPLKKYTFPQKQKHLLTDEVLMVKQVFMFRFLSLSADKERFINIYKYLEKLGCIWLTKTTNLDSVKKKEPHDTSCGLNISSWW